MEVKIRFKRHLLRGGSREIGGVLMGEYLKPGIFKVVDFSVDYGGGTIASFIRSINSALRVLNQFFDKTKHNYKKYNYLGEWHSHPSFSPYPSSKDIETCQRIVEDQDVGANFITLLIIRINNDNEIEGSVSVFRSQFQSEKGLLVFDG